MLLTVGISFYTTRIVLSALGATDFGLYNLVAGVIAMLSFLNVAMTTSTQRFLSFHQGNNNWKMQSIIFSNSLFLHICLALLLFIIIEIIGIFLFNGLLNVPDNRLEAAKIIYHFMAISVGFSVVSVPFVASITAHENMLYLAIVSVLEVLLKLIIALSLTQLIFADSLIFYGISMSIIGLVSLLFYSIYSLITYKECSLNIYKHIEKRILLKLTSFAGWNLFGSLCGVGRIQGLAVILNLFFGTIINAAYGIANQVAAQMTFFSSAMLGAINPQIMKSEGMGNRSRMLMLAMMASKYGFFLLSIVAIPCIFEMETLLALWLKEVPDSTVTFCQLILIGTMTNQLTIGLQSAFQATGEIKLYQIVVGTIILLNLPLAYFLLYTGYPAYSILISYILIEVIGCTLRVLLLNRVAGLSIKEYLKKIILKSLAPLPMVALVCLLVIQNLDATFRFLITGILSAITYFLFYFFIAMESKEKYLFWSTLRNIKKKII